MAALSLRRSTRLAHAHPATQQSQTRKLRRPHHPRPPPDPEPDQDSSSSDPENELTPRALRALKRQRLALDIDGLPFPPRTRPNKRRKENFVATDLSQLPRRDTDCPKRPSSSLAPQCTLAVETTDTAPQISALSPPIPEPPNDTALLISISTPQSDPKTLATLHELSLTATFPNKDSDPQELSPQATTKPEPSIPISQISTESPPLPPITPHDPSTSPEPLTPLTPLTPSPESSPSLPGHDRQASVPSPPPVSLENLPLSHPSDSTRTLPTPSPSISLNPVLDTLVPFEGLPSQFEHELGVQLTSQSPQPPQLPVLDFPDQFTPFSQPQIYVPPYPDPRREANIWKVACRERVECILKYTRKTIKELLAPEAHPNSQETRGSRHSLSLDPTGTEFDATLSNTPSPTKFRLYTPASYTYSSTSWDSTLGARKALEMDEEMEDGDAWVMDDGDWVDGDIDMEDEDDDDYEDDDDVEPGDAEDTALADVEGLTVRDSSTLGTSTTPASEADCPRTMQVDASERSRSPTQEVMVLDPPIPPALPTLPVAAVDPPPRPSTPPLQPYPPSPPVTPERLPPLSSLQVPILSEPSRSFMGRGTPPDRRRLIEWSGAGQFATIGMGPPLYLSPVPQHHASTDVGIVSMSVDESMQPPDPQPQPTHGEWTSFLYSMLEGDGVGVGTTVNDASHGSESAWYELGLGSVPAPVPTSDLGVPLSHSHPHPRTPSVEQVVDDGNSSSTLRFALG